MRLSDTHWVHEAVPLPPLSFVTYEDQDCGGGVFSAHCLELDIGGQGATADAAIKDLQEALELYILAKLDEGENIAHRPAPKELWALPSKKFFPLLLRLRKRRKERQEVVFAPPAPAFGASGLQFA